LGEFLMSMKLELELELELKIACSTSLGSTSILAIYCQYLVVVAFVGMFLSMESFGLIIRSHCDCFQKVSIF
jgi:hypothetical protein